MISEIDKERILAIAEKAQKYLSEQGTHIPRLKIIIALSIVHERYGLNLNVMKFSDKETLKKDVGGIIANLDIQTQTLLNNYRPSVIVGGVDEHKEDI